MRSVSSSYKFFSRKLLYCLLSSRAIARTVGSRSSCPLPLYGCISEMVFFTHFHKSSNLGRARFGFAGRPAGRCASHCNERLTPPNTATNTATAKKRISARLRQAGSASGPPPASPALRCNGARHDLHLKTSMPTAILMAFIPWPGFASIHNTSMQVLNPDPHTAAPAPGCISSAVRTFCTKASTVRVLNSESHSASRHQTYQGRNILG